MGAFFLIVGSIAAVTSVGYGLYGAVEGIKSLVE